MSNTEVIGRHRGVLARSNGRADPSIALVHDYLNQRGGAERVVLEMTTIWPHAPIYTSLYRPRSTFPEFVDHDVRATFLDRAPVDRRFRSLFLLYPAAFRSLGRIDADVVISSSTGWAHAVRAAPTAVHVVYCHSPARWLYAGREDYLSVSRARRLARPFFDPLIEWDRKAAHRADIYVANSVHTRQKIRQAYGIDATVVPPPVQVERFRPAPRGERLLIVSRLLAYKRVDIAVRAAAQARIGLDIVGIGPDMPRLQAMAGSEVTFHGRLDDHSVTKLMEGCRALCVPGTEDFGITAVEAQAAGKPVVAFAGGGALETVQEGYTGAFFDEPRPQALLDAVERADAISLPPELIAASARRFSAKAFRSRFSRVVARATRTAPSIETGSGSPRHRRSRPRHPSLPPRPPGANGRSPGAAPGSPPGNEMPRHPNGAPEIGQRETAVPPPGERRPPAHERRGRDDVAKHST
jgi:glycosyltransferase involved in cell wall biosynthesis